MKKFIVPELEKSPNVLHGNPRIADVSDTTDQPTWSGLSVKMNAPYISIWGTWMVPTVSYLPNSLEGKSSIWVGLDDAPIAILSLLQAGTEQDISFPAFGNYCAFFEWFPQPQIQVNNFSIEPGQSVAVFVGNVEDLPGGNQGLVKLLNRGGNGVDPCSDADSRLRQQALRSRVCPRRERTGYLSARRLV